MQVVDSAFETGYDTMMIVVEPVYLSNKKLDDADLQRIDDAIAYVASKNMLVMLRWMHKFDRELAVQDYWNDGTAAEEFADLWDPAQRALMIDYDRQMGKRYGSHPQILTLSPTFGFLGQSLFDAGNFDAVPYGRCTGYSTYARDAFNTAFGYSGELPVPGDDGEPQDMRTIHWFQFRQRKLTEYAEAAVQAVKSYTTKPVGVFAELYPATFVHQSEASPERQDFWLQDCSFGSQSYDMKRTFAETHGGQEHFERFEDWLDAIIPRLEDAVAKGNKLMGFWWRDKPTYSLLMLPYIQELERKYAERPDRKPKIGVLFQGNYSAAALPNENKFIVQAIYREAPYAVIERLDQHWNEIGFGWEMIPDNKLGSVDFGAYQVVFLIDFTHFDEEAWSNLSQAKDTTFVITGDFARAAYFPAHGNEEATQWGASKRFENMEIEYVENQAGTIEILDFDSRLTQQLDTEFLYEADRWASFRSFSGTDDMKVVASIAGMPFILTRAEGRQVYIPNRLFGMAKLRGDGYLRLANQLIDNIMVHAGG